MSAASTATGASVLRYEPAEIIIAAGIGAYIVGVTWFARTEAKTSSRIQLGLSIGVMVSGIVLLALFPHVPGGAARLQFRPEIAWPLLLVLLSFSIVRRCFAAVLNPQPVMVQTAVKQCIMSLIVLDAAVCLAATGSWIYPVAVLALLAPMLVLGKRVYST